MIPPLKRAKILLSAALPIALLCGFSGCKKESEIDSVQVPKETQSVTPVADSGNAPDANTELASPGDLRWTLPPEWKQVPPPPPRMGIRAAAAIQIFADKPDTLITISKVGGGAASVYPNLKRWAGIIDLPAPADSDIGNMVVHRQNGDVSLDVVDLTNPSSGKRLLGAVIYNDSETWALKVSGPSDLLMGQKGRFVDFLSSLRLVSAAVPGDSTSGSTPPPIGPPAPSSDNAGVELSQGASGVQWKLPAGWTIEAAPTPTVARIHPDGNGASQIKVSKFNGGVGGGLSLNVNRWRGEVGLPKVAEQDADPGQTVKVGDSTLTLHDYTGPADGGTRQIVVSTDAGGATWYFKFIGRADVVGAQKQAFDQFLASLRFGP